MDGGTFLIILLFVLVIIVVLLAAGASWLQRTIATNKARQDQLLRQRETLRLDATTAKETLAGFETVQTARFQKLYEEAAEQKLPKVERATQEVDLAATATAAEAPQGFGAALAQLVQKPGEALAVSRAAQALNDNEMKLADGRKQMTALQQTIDQLSAMRSLMQEDAIRLQSRLTEIGETLAGEQAAGISGLDEWHGPHEGLADQAAALREQIESDETFDVVALDEIGQALEATTRAADELGEEVNHKRTAREAFDALLEVADGKLQNVTTQLEEAGRAALAQPLLAHLSAFFGEARAARQVADFSTATSRVEASVPLQSMLETAVSVSQPISELDKVKTLSLQSEAIESVQNQLTDTWEQMGEGLSMVGDETFPAEELAERTAVFQRQLAEVGQAGTAVQEAHEGDVRRLTNEVNAVTVALKTAWDSLLGKLPLNDEEPLTERYQTQLEAEADAAGLPLALQAYSETTQELTGDVQEAERSWDSRLAELDGQVANLPALDKANEMANGWASLQPFAERVGELSAAAKASRETAVSSPTLAAAYAAAEQGGSQVAESKTTYETLAVRWGQLHNRKALVEMILKNLQPDSAENGEEVAPNPVAEKVVAASEASDVREAIDLLKTAVAEAEALLDQ